MAAALSLLVILTVSVFIIRIAAIALRMTGMPDRIARFQCLSALTGAGFTTSESEMIVNYPVRRRIIALLIIAGNVGLLSLSATLVVSLLNTDGEPSAIAQQVAWLGGTIVVVWLIMLNPFTDRVLCSVIGRLLASTTELGRRRYLRTLQVCNGFSVAEHYHHSMGVTTLAEFDLETHGLTPLAVLRTDGGSSSMPVGDAVVSQGDRIVLYGPDDAHERFEDAVDARNAQLSSSWQT